MNEADRRGLPPLSALDSLIVAVRTNSFSRAADRLVLTQSAVSRRIALLEDWLRIPLFERHGRRVVATKQATAFVDAIEPAIRRIRTATLAAMAPDPASTLTIATLPSFGMRWLAPRLPGLTGLHPELIVNFAARSIPFDFAEEPSGFQPVEFDVVAEAKAVADLDPSGTPEIGGKLCGRPSVTRIAFLSRSPRDPRLALAAVSAVAGLAGSLESRGGRSDFGASELASGEAPFEGFFSPPTGSRLGDPGSPDPCFAAARARASFICWA